MADSPFKGLLYSPEVLGGIGLLTAGLSGKAPDTALPMMMQGMKTASMFSAMEEEEEKRKLIKEYADQVPEDQKKLFKAFPKLWLEKNVFAKDKAFKTKTIVKDGVYKTVDVTNKTGQDNFSKLINSGWVESSVTTKGSEAGLTKKSEGKTEETIIGGNELLANLENQKLLFKDEFLDAKGKAKYKLLLEKDRFSGFTGVPLTTKEKQYINSYSAWQQTNLQYFNQYRKIITGVAAGEKEIGWLQESIPSEKDTPNTYKAKLDNQIRIQKALIENAEKFKVTKGKIYNEKGEYSEEYLNYLKGKVKPNGEYLESRIKAYVIDNGYDEDTIYGILDGEFKGTNWREILQIYLNAKGGKL
jgi:hypothetical protein